MNRGRRSVAVDLKHPEGVALVLRLVEQADGLMEGFRPGVAERLGLGPDVCLARNPKLVFGRMTGWGQDGPMAQRAGHDIDYIALAGALEPVGRAGQAPLPPLNLVGDFGGGGMLLAFGMLAAIINAQRQTGVGQVVDAAMVDGAASLMTMNYTLRNAGIWPAKRGTNVLDTGAHFYEVYETSDGGFISVGAIEPQFYAELIRLIGLEGEDLPAQMDRDAWPEMKKRFAHQLAGKTRGEWEAIFEGSDACAAPVLSPGRGPRASAQPVPGDLHRGGRSGPAVAVAAVPRNARVRIRRPPPNPGQHGDEALADWGLSGDEIDGPAHLGSHPLAPGAVGPASEVDHRAGHGPGDPLDHLDGPDHHAAQLVDGVGLGAHDDVVGPGHPLGGHHAVQGGHGAGHQGRPAHLGLDQHVGVDRHGEPPGTKERVDRRMLPPGVRRLPCLGDRSGAW